MKWKTLQHNGIMFPPEYESRHIKIKIRGKDVKLDIAQEEMIYHGQKRRIPRTCDRVFQKTLRLILARKLSPEFKKISYKDIDFSAAYRDSRHGKGRTRNDDKGGKKGAGREEKEIREKLKEEYGTATMDRKRVDIASYMAEPPGIFIGRGKHPLRGRWKPRVTSKDVTLNLGKRARVPKVPKGTWGSIVCENDATWLAKWTDRLTDKTKYVWLADTAGLKQDKDKAKYEKAARLGEKIDSILDRMVQDHEKHGRKDPHDRHCVLSHLQNSHEGRRREGSRRGRHRGSYDVEKGAHQHNRRCGRV